MRVMLPSAVTLAGVCLLPHAALAQQPPNPAVCELHIWPAKENLAVIYYNDLNPGRDKPFIQPNERPTPKALDQQRQLALLSSIDPSELGMPGATVVRHLEPVDRLEASKPVRHSSSDSMCQGELLIGAFVYESYVYARRSLRLMAAFRRFDGQRAEPSWSFSTYASAPLTRYPAKRIEDVDAANADLERAYVEAVHTFISYEQKASTGTPRAHQ